MYPPSHIARMAEGNLVQSGKDIRVSDLVIDSRKLFYPERSVFFALKGERNGHSYIKGLYEKGVRCFVISEFPEGNFPEGNFIYVPDTLHALQLVARRHREQFNFPVIGITGSNGKTIVKEWLNQLLEARFHIVRSPRSFNSQIGVPLSIWQMNTHHQLGIFEAGISRPGEMEQLEPMILPDFGVLTHIGEAHDEGFENKEHKIREKLILFRKASRLVYNEEDGNVHETVNRLRKSGVLKAVPFTFGKTETADLQLKEISIENNISTLVLWYEEKRYEMLLPFLDPASIENALACLSMLLLLKIPLEESIPLFAGLSTVAMRMELKKGVFQSTIINDGYSADMGSLRIALEFLSQQSGQQSRTVILSDLQQHGRAPEKLYAQVAEELKRHDVNKLIGIGREISEQAHRFETDQSLETEFFPDTDSFKHQFQANRFRNQAILLKGARTFGFEQISQLLEQKVHQTILEIHLSSLSHNLRTYRKLLRPATKIMAMVKAFSYGSGSVEIAAHLQFLGVDYLTVAYADEGVELRKGGITAPIMVMNPEPATFEAMLQYDLEPEVYGFKLLEELEQFMRKQGVVDYPVHIELETGMNRLGFLSKEAVALGEKLRNSGVFKVKSVFSHLVASEDPSQDGFTEKQASLYTTAAAELEKILGYSFLRHLANTAGTARHPQLQFDMVRMGIGLYGVSSSKPSLPLIPVSTLYSTIAQLKHLNPGDTVSYGRRGLVEKPSLIATIRIGYADGYPRLLGNGNGKMRVNGHLAPTMGSVCMDMTMVDVTGIPGVKEGMQVEVFGTGLPVERLAEWAGTIPYEILTSISQRVKRVYVEE